MKRVRCDTAGEVGACKDCECSEPHEWALFHGMSRFCRHADHRIRCNPVEEPAKRCGQCGADLAVWKELFGREHECFAPATDLTSPLRPPRGPALYHCTKGKECGFPDCTAAPDHTHYVPIIHGPRECGLLRQDVECEKVGAPAPLKGVYFSGKAVEVLSMLHGMDPDDWDELWAMVTGKIGRPIHEMSVVELEEVVAKMEPSVARVHHQKRPTWAQDQMAAEKAERDGVPESMTAGEWENSVRTIIVEELGLYDNWAWSERLDNATARIVALPPGGDAPSQTLPIGGWDEAHDRQFGPSGRTSEK